MQWDQCQNRKLRNQRRTTVAGVPEPESQSHYFIKRDPMDNNKGDRYTYYAVLNQDHGKDQGLFEVIGHRRGSCKIGDSTNRDMNKDCGFQQHLLQSCIEDRGRKPSSTIPNSRINKDLTPH